MGKGSLDKVGKVLYRALLKAAKTFDERPATKALITRGLGPQLPEPLDTAVATFLGGKEKCFFWPAPLAPHSVVEAVQFAFRYPTVAEPTIDGGFQGLRYLSALLNIARNSGMLEKFAVPITTASTPPHFSHPVEEISQPRPGAILIAHPCLPAWFSRTIVLLCDHTDTTKTMGLVLNKPFGGNVLDLITQGRKVGAVNLGLDLTSSSSSSVSSTSVSNSSNAISVKENIEMMTLGGGGRKKNSTSTGSTSSSTSTDSRLLERDGSSFPLQSAIVLNDLSGEESDGGSSDGSDIEILNEEDEDEELFSSDFSDDDDEERTWSLLEGLEEMDEEEEQRQERLFEAISLLSGGSGGGDGLSSPSSSLEGLFNIDASEDGVELVFETDDEETMKIVAAAAAALTEEWRKRGGHIPGTDKLSGSTFGDLSVLSKEAMSVVDNLADGPQKEALMAMLDALGNTHRSLVQQLRGIQDEEDKEEEQETYSSVLRIHGGQATFSAAGGKRRGLHTTTTSRGGAGGGDGNITDAHIDSPSTRITHSILPQQHKSTNNAITTKELMAVSPKSQVYLGGPLPGAFVLRTEESSTTAASTLGGKPILGNVDGSTSDRVVVFGAEVTLPQAAAALAPRRTETDPLPPSSSKHQLEEENLREKKSSGVTPDQLKFYVGSSLWAPNQLKQELNRGSWTMIEVDSAVAVDVFEALSGGSSSDKVNPSEAQAEAWQRVLGMVSPAHAALAAVPESAWQELQVLEI